jgi:hypothetical protein
MLTDLFWVFCIKLGYTLYKFLRLEWWVIFLSVGVEPVVCETQAEVEVEVEVAASSQCSWIEL